MSEGAESSAGYDYFVKRLGRQEMGSRASREARGSRGRYILVGRNALDMLPPHSNRVLNDHAFIGFSPLFVLPDERRPSKTYLEYVFHNSRLFANEPEGRNEHRIYLSKGWDQGQMFEGDIIVIRRKRPDELNDLKLVKEDIVSPHDIWDYYVDWLRPDLNPGEWQIYDRLIRARSEPRSPNSIRVPECLEMFEAKVSRCADQKTEIDERIVRSCLKSDKEDDSLFNEQSFRDFVLSSYDYDCAVSHEPVNVGPHSNLETVRIVPLNEGGRLTPKNGIALRTDLAWAFRKGMFTIDPQTRQVRVHEAVKHTYLAQYEGRTVTTNTPVFEAHEFFLKKHAEHIWGRFLRI